ncbi:hypothetical protein [Occallatibacter savannae]|uniref:hypothetical protein n=1 Tax=Occallatibacter savannae TaxID=1002691 RepID=UPI0013A56C62|nr:hypothetical protein [Occallatibacter savannae]
MRRREPPPLATWMLRHLSAEDRDEALDGDLLEVFHFGRSDGWYWRQVIVACAVSWCSNLFARRAPLAFALLWSILAPVWYAILERIDTSQNFDRGEHIFGPFWLPLVLIIWVVLHAAFLWAGLLVYRVANIVLKRPIHVGDMARAFWVATLILPPVYGLSFLFATLYWYSVPGLAGAKLPANAWGLVLDLDIFPNLIRAPYFIAMAVALWGTVRRLQRDENAAFSSSFPAAEGPLTVEDSQSLHRSLTLMVGAGLVNSMIAAVFFCHLPETDFVHPGSLFGMALRFIAICTGGGILGSWLYWKSPVSPLRNGSPLPFGLFAFTCSAGWIWIPALVLLAEQVSAATAFVAMVGAFALTSALKTESWFAFEPSSTVVPQWNGDELFAETLSRSPQEPYGYLIALSLFAGGAAVLSHSMYTAMLMLATSGSVFAWKNTLPRNGQFEPAAAMKRSIRRVAITIVPATLLTVWALIDGMAHRSAAVEASAAAHADQKSQADSKTPIGAAGAGGYESVVLWPFPRKKEIVPPVLADDSFFKRGVQRPLVIRFNGPYWVLQPPLRTPGPHAHRAQGTPVSVDLQSNNAIALVMNAHQKLAKPIPLARCREIDVEIENRDNKAGIISLGLFLGDESSGTERTFYVGQQPIASTEPEHYYVKMSPVYETIRFQVPASASLRQFDEMTLMFLPDIEHTFVAPKIAIRQFELFPR